MKCLNHLACVQTLFDSDDSVPISVTGDNNSMSGLNHKLKEIQDICNGWLHLLPEEKNMPNIPESKSSDVTASSLERCLAREVVKAIQVLKKVTADLILVR